MLPTCPECGGRSFTIDTQAETEVAYAGLYPRRDAPLDIRRRVCTVGFCNTCEFCIEIRNS